MKAEINYYYQPLTKLKETKYKSDFVVKLLKVKNFLDKMI